MRHLNDINHRELAATKSFVDQMLEVLIEETCTTHNLCEGCVRQLLIEMHEKISQGEESYERPVDSEIKVLN